MGLTDHDCGWSCVNLSLSNMTIFVSVLFSFLLSYIVYFEHFRVY